MNLRPLFTLITFLIVGLSFASARGQALLYELSSSTEYEFGRYGVSLTGVPDLDGDGRGDFAIDAYGETSYAGRVHVYSGATGAELYFIEGTHANAFSGWPVAGVPDLDGDGRGDLLIGEVDGDEVVRVHSGADGAYLYTIVAPNEPFFDLSIALAGTRDLDGDGAGDIIIGAPYEPVPGRGRAGRAYVFSGATGALRFVLTSPRAEQRGRFGCTVASAPDTNGDGIDDLLVGASAEDSTHRRPGRAYLFSGADGSLLRHLKSPTPQMNGNFGATLTALHDINGDGRGDLAIAGPTENSSGAVRSGRVHLFSGRTGRLLYSLDSPNAQTDGAFGATAARTADLDRDGIDDLIAATAYEDPPGSPANAGRAYVYSGANGALLYTLSSPHEESGGLFGNAVAGVDDADGDGQGDVLVGAYYEGDGTPGRAYLFSGNQETAD